MVREYARERLAERGEHDATMHRFACYLRDFSARAGAALDGPDNHAWLAQLDAELDNLRAALGWAVEADEAELAIRNAAPLSRYWWRRGLLGEMLDLAERNAALPSAETLSPEGVALLLWCRGTTRIAFGSTADAEPILRQLVDRARELGDARLLAHGLTGLALTLPFERSAAQVRDLLTEALALFRRAGDSWGIGFVLGPLGQVTLRDGDPHAAATLHREALERAEHIDDDHLRAQALNQLALDAMIAGQADRARAELLRAADVQRRLLDQEGVAYTLEGFAAVALAAGSAAVAARLLGAARGTRSRLGVAVWPLLRPLSDALAAAVRAALDPQVHDREHTTGAALRPLDALDLAVARLD